MPHSNRAGVRSKRRNSITASAIKAISQAGYTISSVQCCNDGNVIYNFQNGVGNRSDVDIELQTAREQRRDRKAS